jgi:acyl-CoA dehydrogenase
MLMGTEEQKARFLGIFEDKEVPQWAAFAMTEPSAGSDVAALRTTAEKDGDSYVLNGEKCFISNGKRASWVVVWATVDPSLGRAGHRAFVVERGTPGFEVARVDKKMGLTASETATLRFENCRVPQANMLGSELESSKEKGFGGAMKTFNMTRPIVAAMAVGIGRAAHDEAWRFAKEAFDGTSGYRLDRIRDRFALIRRKLESARMMALHAAWKADLKQNNTMESAMSKAYAPPVALEAASLGLEILGQAGGASDLLIEKLFRDVKVLDIVEGTGQIQKTIIARSVMGYDRTWSGKE